MADDRTTPDVPQESAPGAVTPPAAVPPPPAMEPTVPDLAIPDAVIPPPPAADAIPADLPIPDFVIPPAPSADAIPDAVIPPPPAADAIPDAVIPPPPAADAIPDALLAPPLGVEPPRPPSTVPDPDSQEWPVDSGPSAYIDAAPPSSGSYRVLTAVILAVLLLLLGGAIALIVYLAGHTTFSLPGAEPGPDPQPGAVEVTDGTSNEVMPLIGDPCSDFCTDIGTRIGEVVVGADGGSAWQVSRSWETTELSDLPSEETTVAAYDADAGTLSMTVWRFADDASAQAAYDQLNAGLGDVAYSGSVYEDGTGDQRAYIDGGIQTIVWIIVGDESQPWVMQVQGPDVSGLEQFYLALPL